MRLNAVPDFAICGQKLFRRHLGVRQLFREFSPKLFIGILVEGLVAIAKSRRS